MKTITVQPYKRSKPGGTYKTIEVKGYTRILESEDDLTIRENDKQRRNEKKIGNLKDE